jgi:hypothetical protein
MIINLNLHPEYCELADGDNCPCLNKNDDNLGVTYCAYFKDKLGGIWRDGNGYHILRLANCKKADK